MKRHFVLFLTATGMLFSCSPDDDDSSTPAPTESDYFPTATGTYWTYDVSGSAAGSSGRDSLYVSGDTIINTKTYSKIKARAGAIGFFANTINNNAVRKEGAKVLMSGQFTAAFTAQLPIEIALDDFVFFDKDAVSGTQLDTFSGTVNVTVSDYPVTIDYLLTTTAGATLASYTAPNGTVYEDVKAVNTIVNVTATTIYSGFSLPVLPAQDVIVSIQYYAQGVGIVNTDTTISYSLSMDIGSGIPQTQTQTQTETLDDFVPAN